MGCGISTEYKKSESEQERIVRVMHERLYSTRSYEPEYKSDNDSEDSYDMFKGYH